MITNQQNQIENNKKQLDSEESLLDIKLVKYSNKSINLFIKKSGIVLKINNKKNKYIFQDSIVGTTVVDGKLILSACVVKRRHKDQRKRKTYTFSFPQGGESEAHTVQQMIQSTFLNTLPRGHPRNRKIRILINPKSGKKESETIFKEIEKLFKDSEIQIKRTITMEPEHAKKIGFKFNYTKYDTVVFISGDGLFHEFINGMLSREDYEEAKKVPLALIPAGTGNGIACSIGLQDPMNAALAVIHGFTKPLDVCIVQQGDTKWCSILSLTWGLVSDVDIESEKYRSLGDLRLILGAAIRILNLRIYKGKVLFLPALDESVDKSKIQNIPKCVYNCEICDSTNSIKVIESKLLNNNNNSNGEDTTSKMSITNTDSENPIIIPSNNSDISASGSPLSASVVPTPKSASGRSDINLSSNSAYKSLDINHIPSTKINHENYLTENQDHLLENGWRCIDGEFIGVVASTVTHLASDFISSPNAHLSDGLIDLVLIRNNPKLSKASLLSILTDSATGDHLKSDLIEHHKVKALILEPGNERTGIIAIDGERIKYGKTSMENVRGLINIIVSPNATNNIKPPKPAK
ncbi:hypothetical protein DICPUDRAFT_76939 [Dictyostelium purpureum]|uniref:DAGKc domain-containing protein n=1 Tax=Dictyostelium purpureum TaxID=5786 RepID=F0ZF43_DICPU|nr:uncharacterized protein DICPUDRAFT_76939 [Dictyostelium purpureum]EGC37474.1 hypothetical protein DICPUDRAFT_76939 [Dictyostelium purpureum]|eukprot:XP_003286038.1 hypothetical protein DICPUDRAFT_76939 [Dictyostelium purpureum]